MKLEIKLVHCNNLKTTFPSGKSLFNLDYDFLFKTKNRMCIIKNENLEMSKLSPKGRHLRIDG